MALTDEEVRILNELTDYEPALRKNQLSRQMELGTRLQEIEAAAGASVTGIVLANSSGENTSYDTIAAALAAAVSGDIVYLAPGSYNESVTVPAGVALHGPHGAPATIAGGAATGTRVTLSSGSTLVHMKVSGSTDAPAVASSASSGILTLSDVDISGAGAGGDGFALTGAATAICNNVNFSSGTAQYALFASAGRLVVDNCSVIGGTITHGIHIESGAFCRFTDYTVSPLSTTTHAIHIGDASLSGDIAYLTAVAGLHIDIDGHQVEVSNVTFVDCTTDLLITPGVTSGKLHLSGHMTDRKISADLAYRQGADLLLLFQDETPGDQGFRIWGELNVGQYERGYESVFGEGDSHVRNMSSFTNTNGEAGTWVDNTSVIASSTGSTVAMFPGVTAENCFYVGGEMPFPGVRCITTAAIVLGAGAIAAEYWNGSSWTTLPVMATQADSNLLQYGDTVFQRIQTEQIRFGETTGWATKALNGATKYWMRWRITTGITTSPTLEQIKLHTNRFEINIDGAAEQFGTAERSIDLVFTRETSIPLDGSVPAPADISLTTNITANGSNNRFASNATDGRVAVIPIPPGLDTSRDLTFTIGWIPSNTDTGNVLLEVNYAVIKAGDVLNGAITDANASVSVPGPGVTGQLMVSTISFAIPKAVPSDFLVMSFFRIGPGDAFTGHVDTVFATLTGRFWQ